MSGPSVKKKLLEKQIEEKGHAHAKIKNVLHLKFTSPARMSVPDRLLLSEIPPFLRDIIACHVRFIEYKREGQKPTDAQKREHERLRALGFAVDVIDNVEDAKKTIDGMSNAVT